MNIKKKNGNWTFGKNIPKIFDTHISRSIPDYHHSIELISNLSTYFLKENSVCIDIGFSTGTLIEKINQINLDKNINFIGIEPEIKMVNFFKKKKSFKKIKKIKIINKTIENIKLIKSDFIISNFTIQFTNLNNRGKILSKIYNSLNIGGGFVFFEKIYGNDPFFEKIFNDMLIDFKVKQKFSEQEIISKNKAIRGIMRPLREEDNLRLLKKAGFKKVQVINQKINFQGILAIK